MAATSHGPGDAALAAYRHKTVTLRSGGRRLALETSQELFSSHQVDRGSRLLLRLLTEHLGDELAGAEVLDVGCGYGPLGIGLVAGGARHATLVDRDVLAVRFATHNAAANGVTATACPSLDYEALARRAGRAGPPGYDLVVSNLPGHAPEPVLTHLVAGAGWQLRAGARAGFVVVEPLVGLVHRAVGDAGGEVVASHTERGHHVAIARFPGPPRASHPGTGLEAGAYRRGEATFARAGLRWRVETGHGVPEFSGLSHHTAALVDDLAGRRRGLDGARVAVWNPGVGHLAVVATALAPVAALTLVDRDVLALACAERNVLAAGSGSGPASARQVLPGLDLGDAPTPAGGFDLVVDVLRRSEPPAAQLRRLEVAVGGLAPGGVVLVGGERRRVERLGGLLADAAPRVRHRLLRGRRAARLEVAAAG